MTSINLKKHLYSTFLTIISIIVLLSIPACNNQAKANSDKAKKTEEAIPVEAATVQQGSISAYFTGTASLEAQEEAFVVSKTGGIIKKIFVEEGNTVKTNQILAQLDDDKATLDLAEAEAYLKKLETDFYRSQELHQKNIVSTELMEKSKTEYEMAKARRDQAKLLKDYTTIRSPFDGIISERLIKTGNMVAMNAPCFRVTDFDPLLAVLHVPEKELNKLKTNQKATLEVDALSQNTFTGDILRISPVVDPKSGTFKVTLAVKDPTNKLKPGMFARVKIVYDIRDNTLLVPKDAVLTEGNESVVFIVSPKDKTVHRKIVETGYINTTHIEIKSGANLGDQVIITGISGMKDGSKVEILPSTHTNTNNKSTNSF